MQKLDPIVKKFHLTEFEKVKPIKKLANYLNIEVGQLIVILAFIILILLIIGLANELLIGSLGIFYPGYMSLKSLQNENERDNKMWLTYWIIFSIFTIFDILFKYILFFLPIYFVLKGIFFIWLFHPRSKGASLVYDSAIRPLIKKYQNSLNENINKIVNGFKVYQNQFGIKETDNNKKNA